MDTSKAKEKKSTDAQMQASVKYNRKQDNIMIRPSKEDGAEIRKAAEEAGQSVQAYVLQAVRERMKRDKNIAPGFGISETTSKQ